MGNYHRSNWRSARSDAESHAHRPLNDPQTWSLFDFVRQKTIQAYRARFDADAAASNLHPAASVELRDKPTLVDSIPH
jgi:hypothetical protein